MTMVWVRLPFLSPRPVWKKLKGAKLSTFRVSVFTVGNMGPFYEPLSLFLRAR